MTHLNRTQSVIACRCPKCGEGRLFKYPLKKLTAFGTMHESCENCGQTFMPEPSFYMGALFISYAIQIVIFLVTFFSLKLTGLGHGVSEYVTTMAAMVVITFPTVYRLSRSIWIHLFIPYDSKNIHQLTKLKQV